MVFYIELLCLFVIVLNKESEHKGAWAPIFQEKRCVFSFELLVYFDSNTN